jgi:hypothetical protein
MYIQKVIVTYIISERHVWRIEIFIARLHKRNPITLPFTQSLRTRAVLLLQVMSWVNRNMGQSAAQLITVSFEKAFDHLH